MRRFLVLLCLLAVSSFASDADAQPGQAPPSQGQDGWGAPPGSSAPGWGAPRPAPALLTPEERQLILRGEISTGQHILGGVVAHLTGFGLGHAVQGRFSEKGYIFLVGEAASIGAIIVFVSQCGDSEFDERTCENNVGWLIGGTVGLIGFRIWELIDVWNGPIVHNRRVRRARAKAYGAPAPRQYGFFAAPTKDGGGMAGLSFTF